MADITVRRDGGQALAQQPEWQPFRTMRSFFNWDPFREMAPLFEERMATTFWPAFEIHETKEGYQFKADLPGVKDGDLEVSMTGNLLTVGGKREAEKRETSDKAYLYERTYGSFQRSFTMPEGTDAEHVRAELKDGVLLLVVPKKPEMQAKKITIKTGEKNKS